MITLKNIKIINNIISANVETVEAHPEQFQIEIDLVEKKIVKNTRGKIDQVVTMAMAKLIKLADEMNGNVPTEAESVWY